MKKIKTCAASLLKAPETAVIFAMFLPVFAEQVLITLMGTVHTIMLANSGEQREYAMSAVTLVDQINQFAIAVFNSISIGATVVVSQYIGSNKRLPAIATAEQAVTLGLLLSSTVGAVFFVFDRQIFLFIFGETDRQTIDLALIYLKSTAVSFPMLCLMTTASGILRGSGDSRNPMLISVIVGLVNAAISSVMIFVFDMSVTGVSIAMITARTAGSIIAATLLIRKGFLRGPKFLLRLKPRYIKQILNIGIYAAAENIIFQLGKLLTSTFYVPAGRYHINANGIMGSLFGILAAPGNSMSITATTLVGRYIGAGEKEKAYKILRNIMVFVVLLHTGFSFVFVPLSPLLIRIYTDKKEVFDLVMALIIWNAIFVSTAWPFSFTLFSGMKGAGDARYATVVSITSMWLMRVLFGYILGLKLGYGVIGVWFAMFFDWCFRGTLAGIRFKRRKWLEKKAI